MIRINLAKPSAFPSEEGAAPSSGGFSLPSLDGFSDGTGQNPALKIGLILIFPVLLYIFEQRGLTGYQTKVAHKNAELGQVKNDIAQFGSAATAVADIKLERDRLQERLQVIAKISSKRAFKIQTLSELQRVIPKDCWVTEVNIKKSEVEFIGFSRNPSSVQNFVESLSALDFLISVANQGLIRTRLGDTNVHKFTVLAQVREP